MTTNKTTMIMIIAVVSSPPPSSGVGGLLFDCALLNNVTQLAINHENNNADFIVMVDSFFPLNVFGVVLKIQSLQNYNF